MLAIVVSHFHHILCALRWRNIGMMQKRIIAIYFILRMACDCVKTILVSNWVWFLFIRDSSIPTFPQNLTPPLSMYVRMCVCDDFQANCWMEKKSCLGACLGHGIARLCIDRILIVDNDVKWYYVESFLLVNMKQHAPATRSVDTQLIATH